MTDSQGYNGWSNRETWTVDLWLSNDEGSYLSVMANARMAVYDAGDDRSAAIAILARQLQEEHDEGVPERADVFTDLLAYALAQVNWHEIAENYVDAVLEENREEPEQ